MVVTRKIQHPIGPPGAAGITHRPHPVENREWQRPCLQHPEVVVEFHDLGVVRVPIRRRCPLLHLVVVGKGPPPVTVVPVQPRERTAVDAETVRPGMLHRVCIPTFHRARHRRHGIVGVRCVKPAVEFHQAVEVNQRIAFGLPGPFRDDLAGRFIVFRNRVIIDGVKVTGINGDTLARVARIEHLHEFGPVNGRRFRGTRARGQQQRSAEHGQEIMGSSFSAILHIDTQ